MTTIDDANGVRTITLDVPAKRNAFGPEELYALEHGLFGGEFAAVVLTAPTGAVFCSGGDLTLGAAGIEALSKRVYDICRGVAQTPTVFVVGCDGLALSGGAQLFAAADLRIIGPRAALEVARPALGSFVAAWSLPERLGRGLSLDLLLTGRRLDAAEMLASGLAERLVEDPQATADEVAGIIAARDAGYRKRVKAIVYAGAQSRSAAIDLEDLTFVSPYVTRAGHRHD